VFNPSSINYEVNICLNHIYWNEYLIFGSFNI
jgi:hypothetical protein